MRTEIKLWGILVPFFLVLTPIYGYFTGWNEWVGLTGLALSTIFPAFIAVYLWMTARKLDPRPDDNPYGEIAEQEGPYGFFSPYSWWPLWLGMASALIFLGVAIGWWLVIIAAPFAAIATVGWTFEYFKGEKAV